jgi:ADP-ribose pyrophosphatase YjhB (NUDIX family)
MIHRIRAAGIAVQGDNLLLVQHVERSGLEYWIPAGGRLEAEDHSTTATVKREFFEETGLDVQVGPLIFVREFYEASKDTYHLELFYLIDSFKGEITTDNLKGMGGDEHLIRQVKWVHRDELDQFRVFPEELRTVLWEKLIETQVTPVHLGKQVETSLLNVAI